MITIGVTGGVGSGKSEVLKFLKSHYNCRILMADNAAKDLEAPGGAVYEPLVQLLEQYPTSSTLKTGESLLDENGFIRTKEMAARMFANPELRAKVNGLIHPAVIKYIVDSIEEEKQKGELDYFFLEAALLIETGFDRIVDHMWYIFCNEAERRRRLAASRGYSDEKTTQIIQSQLSEEEFRNHCDQVIDNSGSIEETGEQIMKALEKLTKSEGKKLYAI